MYNFFTEMGCWVKYLRSVHFDFIISPLPIA